MSLIIPNDIANGISADGNNVGANFDAIETWAGTHEAIHDAYEAAWTTHTPQLDQGANLDIAKTATYSKYIQIGKTVHWSFSLAVTAAGDDGNVLTLTLPVAAAAASAVFGVAAIYDLSTTTRYVCEIEGNSTTKIGFSSDGVSTDAWGASPNLAIASGDSIKGHVTYEAA